MATRARDVLLSLATLLGVLGLGCQSAPSTVPPGPPRTASLRRSSGAIGRGPEAASGDTYIRWLVDRSMLHQAELTARRYSGQGQLWQHPYANPQPRAPRRWRRCGSLLTRPPTSRGQASRCCAAWVTRSYGASSRRSGSRGCIPVP